MVGYFYPRPPRGGRHLEALRVILGVEISIHALREEGDTWAFFAVAVAVFISIHALREEGDLQPVYGRHRFCQISIHALREEGDRTADEHQVQRRYFYPRPPRGGRQEERRLLMRLLRISIHALREEGDTLRKLQKSRLRISIHALREEGDASLASASCSRVRFLSTPSARRATCLPARSSPRRCYFYPRPPRGGRPRRPRR